MDNQAKKTYLLNVGVAVTTAALVYIGAKLLFVYLLPFVFATILAYLVQKPANVISKRLKIKTKAAAVGCVLITYSLLATVIFLLCWWLVVESIDFSQIIIERIKDSSEELSVLNEKISSALGVFPKEISKTISSSIKNLFGDIFRFLGSFASKTAAQIIKKMPQILFCTAVTVIASCYIAYDYERLKNFICEILGERFWERAKTIKEILVHSVFRILWGYIKLSGVAFIELTIGLLILRVKYAPLIAFLIALIDLLPVLGCGAVLLPWALGSFLTTDFYRGTALCIIYVFILVVRYYLEPKIIGKGVGINPLFILLAMFLGFSIASMGGMLLFPIVLIVVVTYYKNQLEAGRGITHTQT